MYDVKWEEVPLSCRQSGTLASQRLIEMTRQPADISIAFFYLPLVVSGVSTLSWHEYILSGIRGSTFVLFYFFFSKVNLLLVGAFLEVCSLYVIGNVHLR